MALVVDPLLTSVDGRSLKSKRLLVNGSTLNVATQYECLDVARRELVHMSST